LALEVCRHHLAPGLLLSDSSFFLHAKLAVAGDLLTKVILLTRSATVSAQVRCGCAAGELFPDVSSWRKLANAALAERQRQRNPLWVALAAGLDVFNRVGCQLHQ
jgi:hypothetical protein